MAGLFSGLEVGKRALATHQLWLNTIGHNIANVNTTGFKRGRPVFESLMYQTVVQPGGESSESTKLPSGLMLGTGVITTATQKMFNQTALKTNKDEIMPFHFCHEELYAIALAIPGVPFLIIRVKMWWRKKKY